MATRIYGTSDDLIEVEGGKASGEVGCYGTDDREQGVLLMCSDGTMLEIKFGKGEKSIWEIKCHEKGTQFDRIDVCTSEDSTTYSDEAFFKSDLKWVYAAKGEWELVK